MCDTFPEDLLFYSDPGCVRVCFRGVPQLFCVTPVVSGFLGMLHLWVFLTLRPEVIV